MTPQPTMSAPQVAVEDAACRPAALRDALLACYGNISFPTGATSATAVRSRCSATSACLQAIQKIETVKCQPTPTFLTVRTFLRYACMRDSSGAVCRETLPRQATDTSELSRCVTTGSYADCAADSSCRALGSSCMRTPVAQQLDTLCSECADRRIKLFLQDDFLLRNPMRCYQTGYGGTASWLCDSVDATTLAGYIGMDAYVDIMGSLLSYLRERATMQGALCSKYNAQWCVLQKLSPPTLPVTDITQATAANLQSACGALSSATGCTRQVLSTYPVEQRIFGLNGTLQFPADDLCSTNAQGEYCVVLSSRIMSLANVTACLTYSTLSGCSAQCQDVVRWAASRLGCCIGVSDSLLNWKRYYSAYYSNSIASMALLPQPLSAQNCVGGLQQAAQLRCTQRNMTTAVEVSFLMNIPCSLLDLNQYQIAMKLRNDLQAAGGLDDSQLIDVRLGCASTVTVTLAPVASSTGASRNRRGHMSALSHVQHAVHVLAASSTALVTGTQASTFEGTRVTLQLSTSVAKQSLAAALAQNNTLTFQSTDALVHEKCASCPAVGIVAKQLTPDNVLTTVSAPVGNAATSASAGTCDPVLLADLITNCSGVLSTTYSTDASALAAFQSLCAPGAGSCKRAIDAIGGVEGMARCARSDNSLAMSLRYVGAMCERAPDNIPCGYYMSYESTTSRRCRALSYASCFSDAACSYDSDANRCTQKLTQSMLNGMCGTCGAAFATAERLLGVPSGAAEHLSLACLRVDNTYCALQLGNMGSGSAEQGMLGMNSGSLMCSTNVTSRCVRLVTTTSMHVMNVMAENALKNCESNCGGLVRALADARASQDDVNLMFSEGCKKNPQGAYCLDAATAFSTDAAAVQCNTLMLMTNTCPSNCSGIMRAAVDALGCCAGPMQRIIQSGTATSDTSGMITTPPSTAAAVNTSSAAPSGLEALKTCIPDISSLTAGDCIAALRKVYKNQLGLKIACSSLDAIRDVLIQRLPQDLAAAAGVPTSSIANVNPQCSEQVAVQLASTASHRRTFHTLATTSGVVVQYELSTSDDGLTDQANAQIQNKINSNELTLSSTETSVAAVCSTCGALAVDQSTSKNVEVTYVANGAAGMYMIPGVWSVVVPLLLLVVLML